MARPEGEKELTRWTNRRTEAWELQVGHYCYSGECEVGSGGR